MKNITIRPNRTAAMTIRLSDFSIIAFGFIFGIYLLCFSEVHAQEGSPGWEERASLAVEQMILSSGDETIQFVLDNFVDPSAMSISEWKERLIAIRKDMHDLNGDVSLSVDPEGLILSMANMERQRDLRIGLNQDNQKISKLQLMEPAPSMDLSWENLDQIFDQLESEGLSGIIYMKRGNEVVMNRPFGMADRSTGRKNKLVTIFGTGSRPIDYTIAAIQLLDQQGKLSLNNPISQFIDEVPDDKKSMTLHHLMTGRSGLPDFFDNDSDWDADLAWVDRDEAVRRMMKQELLFEPGKGRAHSHGAFGLLAAIVEKVSGETYYGFIRKHFLDPAGMTRTGEYGESRGFGIEEFAVGGGPEIVGVPNIPPNWGPTSWLIKGSGGMYSTLGDLQKFYEYIRSGKVLDEKHSRRFREPTAGLDGSMRGFELLSLYEPRKGELYLFINEAVESSKLRALMRSLERLLVRS